MREWVVWDIEVMDREDREALCGTRVEEICSHTRSLIPEENDDETQD